MKFFDYRKVKEELRRFEYLQALSGLRSRIRLKFIVWSLVSFILAFLVVVLLWNQPIPREATLMTGIFVLAGLLWMTEALPLFATAFVIISLEIILIANPGNWAYLGFQSGNSPDFRLFLSPLSDPVIILFLGGFLLAQAAVKEGIDKALASNLLKIFGHRPAYVLLGLMVITAIFSMWMSNTATTAMMITLVIPMMDQIPSNDSFRKALVLCIPFAANIGGLGTPIASPPNAVAVGFLENVGIEIGFLQWMMMAMPLLICMLLIVWGLIWKFYKPTNNELTIKSVSHKIDGRGVYVMVIFSLTILLWLSDSLHGLPTSVVALVPVVGFTTTGIIRRNDINALEWHILILIAGGIALGVGMKITGLDTIFVSLIPKESSLIFPILIFSTLLFSTFMSNTAAANLLIPLGISFATGIGSDQLSMELGIGVALAASLAMSLPVSTPPNAIAYSRGVLSTTDFIKVGVIIGVIGFSLILFGKFLIF